MSTDKNHILSITAAGDICPGDYSILGTGVCSRTKKLGTDFPFQKIAGFFKNSDIAIGNLEGLLSTTIAGPQRSDITFCGLPEFASSLKKAGLTVINVANNHIFEHGPDIFNETIHHLRKAGLSICGLRGFDSYYSEPVFIDKKGYKIGILGYNWVGKDKFEEVDNFIAQSHDSLVNYTWDRADQISRNFHGSIFDSNQNVIQDIETLKTKVDFVILTTHWGYEFVKYPPLGVVKEAHSFIDAGADLIIGGHPHVLQGHEQYNGKWIFYSLGNFIFDMRHRQSKYTAMLEYNHNLKSDDQFKLHSLKINRSFQPIPVNKKTNYHIQNILDDASSIFTSENLTRILEDDIIYKKYETEYNKRKLINILSHFIEIPKNPFVLKTIFKKVKNFFSVIQRKLKGDNIRW